MEKLNLKRWKGRSVKTLIIAIVAVLLSLSFISPAASQTPVNGDTLVDASIGDASTFLPGLASDTASMAIVDQAYKGLVKYDTNFNLVGSLADRWEVSEDQRTIVFHIRPNLVWADGAPFTAEDCVFTWKLMSDPNTPTAYGESFLQIESAEAIDPLTFQVTYKTVFAQAIETWAIGIMPKHLLEGQDLDQSPLSRTTVGTGAFQVESWDTGQRIVLAANPSYWEGRPYLDRLTTRIIPDTATQMMELSTGALDMMSLEPDQWLQAQENPMLRDNYQFFKYLSSSYTYLGFNLKNPKFADARVRRAIGLAIDKDEIIEGVLLGFGQPANGPFKPDMWAYNDKVKPLPFDQAQARRLLAECGWVDSDKDGILDKDGEPFVFTIMTNQGNRLRELTGVIIQSRLKDVGIEVKFRTVEWAAFLKEYLDKHDFEAVIMGWTIPHDPDLFDVFNSKKTNPGELNFVSYSNAEVDELIDVNRFNLDQAVRKPAIDRIQEIFYEDTPYVFLYIPEALVVVSNRFIGPKSSPIGLGYNINEWFVPASKQLYTK
jgi:peptide/nickel transport system substrate-binding protein